MPKKNYRDITVTVRVYSIPGAGATEVIGKHTADELWKMSTVCAAQATRQQKAERATKVKRKSGLKDKIVSLFTAEEA